MSSGRTFEMTLPDGRSLTVRWFRPPSPRPGCDRKDGDCRVEIDGKTIIIDQSLASAPKAMILGQQILISHAGFQAACDWREVGRRSAHSRPGRSSSDLCAPFPGRVVKILIDPPTTVTAKTPLIVLEAMKMEFTYTAPAALRIVRALVKEGQVLEKGTLFFEYEEQTADS